MALPTPTIEVIVSPLLYNSRLTRENPVIIVVDIFRAGTSICSALLSGVEKLIPVETVEEAQDYKTRGYLVAGERGGNKLPFADFGNSPVEISNANLKVETLVLTSTNGTQAIHLSKKDGIVAIGAFTNLNFIAEWILTLKRNVIILCSGWQDTVSLEDSLFAGALTDEIIKGNRNFNLTDSTFACIDLWNSVKNNFAAYLQRGSHYQRLQNLGVQLDLDYALCLNTTRVIPVFENYYLTNILK